MWYQRLYIGGQALGLLRLPPAGRPAAAAQRGGGGAGEQAAGGLGGSVRKEEEEVDEGVAAQVDGQAQGSTGEGDGPGCATRRSSLGARAGSGPDPPQQQVAAAAAAEEGPDANKEEDDAACKKCGRRDGAMRMLLCDGEACNNAYHTFCLTPPLLAAPKGEWFCPHCELKRQVRSNHFQHAGLSLGVASHPHPDASPRASDLLPPTSRVLTFACASRLASVVQAAQGMSSRQQLRYLQLLAEEAAEPPVAPAAGADPRGYTTKYSASRGRTDAASAIAASSAPSSTSGKRPAVPPVQGVAKKSKAAVERGRKKAAEKKPGPSRTAVAPLARPGKSAKSAAAEGPAIRSRAAKRPPRSLSAYALCRSCWRRPR